MATNQVNRAITEQGINLNLVASFSLGETHGRASEQNPAETIPQLEEICREAMQVDKLGDDLDGAIRGDVTEATVDVCRNDDVVTLIRKALPEIEKLIVYKATDDENDGHATSADLLEDAIGTLISNFLIGAARVNQRSGDTTRCTTAQQ